jgi:hypothetical protein
MWREPPRIHGLPVVIKAFGDVEGADLGNIEVAHVIAAVLARPVRILRRYVRDAIEVDVVQDDERAVACRDDVLFQEVRSHRVGHGFGRQGVLRQVA